MEGLPRARIAGTLLMPRAQRNRQTGIYRIASSSYSPLVFYLLQYLSFHFPISKFSTTPRETFGISASLSLGGQPGVQQASQIDNIDYSHETTMTQINALDIGVSAPFVSCFAAV